MKKAEIDDLKEALRLLKEAGWEAMACDTPVPLFENGVPAGNPLGGGVLSVTSFGEKHRKR